jgi:hypothetical protein
MASAKQKQPSTNEVTPYSDEETARFQEFFRPVYPRDIFNVQANDEHFLTAVSLAERNETRCPNFQKEEEIQALSYRLKHLKKDRPEGYLVDAELIVHQLAALKVEIKVCREEFDLVAKAWSQSWKKKEHCITMDEFKKAQYWDSVFVSSQQVILPYLEYKEAEKEAQKKTAGKQKLVRVCDAEVAAFAPAAASAQAPAAADQDDVEVVDTKGDKRPLADVFEAPIPANRCRPRQQKILKSVDQLAKPPTVTNIPEFKGNWANWIAEPWTYKRRHRKGDSKHGNGLRLSADKRIYCGFCGCHIRKDKTGQHLGGDDHHGRYLENKATAERGAAVISQQTIPEAVIQRKAGYGLSEECKEHRRDCFRTMCLGNVAANQMIVIRRLSDKGRMDGVSMSNPNDLARTWGTEIIGKEFDHLRSIIRGCFPEFATISDGTPASGVEVEAVKVRLIREKDYAVVELLASAKLYDKKLSGENTAYNILSVLINKCGLDATGWRAAMMDRASVNGKALKDVNKKTRYDPTMFPCISHTLDNCGKKVENNDVEPVRKNYNKAIKHQGKCAKRIALVMSEKPLVASGVRWWNRHEQREQLNRFELLRVREDVAAFCIEKNYSLAPVTRLNGLLPDKKVRG